MEVREIHTSDPSGAGARAKILNHMPALSVGDAKKAAEMPVISPTEFVAQLKSYMADMVDPLSEVVSRFLNMKDNPNTKEVEKRLFETTKKQGNIVGGSESRRSSHDTNRPGTQRQISIAEQPTNEAPEEKINNNTMSKADIALMEEKVAKAKKAYEAEEAELKRAAHQRVAETTETLLVLTTPKTSAAKVSVQRPFHPIAEEENESSEIQEKVIEDNNAEDILPYGMGGDALRVDPEI